MTERNFILSIPAIANLADKSDGGKVRIRIGGSPAAVFDPSWPRNAVDEPLNEADIERTTEGHRMIRHFEQIEGNPNAVYGRGSTECFGKLKRFRVRDMNSSLPIDIGKRNTLSAIV